MFRKGMIALGAVMLVAGTPALADGPTTSGKRESGAESDASKAKRYCVVAKITGSRLPTKTCKTRAQWLKEDGFDPLAPSKE